MTKLRPQRSWAYRRAPRPGLEPGTIALHLS